MTLEKGKDSTTASPKPGTNVTEMLQGKGKRVDLRSLQQNFHDGEAERLRRMREREIFDEVIFEANQTVGLEKDDPLLEERQTQLLNTLRGLPPEQHWPLIRRVQSQVIDGKQMAPVLYSLLGALGALSPKDDRMFYRAGKLTINFRTAFNAIPRPIMEQRGLRPGVSKTAAIALYKTLLSCKLFGAAEDFLMRLPNKWKAEVQQGATQTPAATPVKPAAPAQPTQ